MSLEQTRIIQAEIDKAKVAEVSQVFRDALLGALSQTRSLTIQMDPTYREKLMDDVTKAFHPDGDAKDWFSDAFHDVGAMIETDIEVLTDELAMARHGIAAE